MVTLRRRLLDTEQNISFSSGNNTDDSSMSRENNFDANMVIILAVLLFSLIGALALNSIVRCALRYRRRLRVETPGEAAARLATTGLKKRALRQIPTAVIGTSGMNIPGTECAICLGDFVDGEKVRVLPKCNHGFHVKCIDTWLMSHSSCPNCRHSLLEPPAALNGASAASLQPPGNRSGQQDHLVVALTM